MTASSKEPLWYRPVILIGGTVEQAHRYARAAGLRRGEFIAPGRWHLIRGYSRPSVVLIGTWRERDDIEELRWALLPTYPRCRDERGRWTSLRA